MSNFRNLDWDLANKNGDIETWERVGIAVLMDIRTELQKLNQTLLCPSFLRIPDHLRRIESNTRRKTKKKAAK